MALSPAYAALSDCDHLIFARELGRGLLECLLGLQDTSMKLAAEPQVQSAATCLARERESVRVDERRCLLPTEAEQCQLLPSARL
jgi:hypothetical protein